MDPNLQGLWRFEEEADSRADSSQNDNTLTDNNTVGSDTTSPPQGTRYASFVRANSEYLSITDGVQVGLDSSGDYSVAMWLRPNTSGYTTFGSVDKRGTSANGYRVYVTAGSLVVWHRRNWVDDYDVSTVNIGDEIRDGNTVWTHLAITYDADTTTVRYYINGQQADSAADLNPSGDGTASFLVSPQISNGYYTGYMDELAFFNRTLSPGEVLTIYMHNIQ